MGYCPVLQVEHVAFLGRVAAQVVVQPTHRLASPIALGAVDAQRLVDAVVVFLTERFVVLFLFLPLGYAVERPKAVSRASCDTDREDAAKNTLSSKYMYKDMEVLISASGAGGE